MTKRSTSLSIAAALMAVLAAPAAFANLDPVAEESDEKGGNAIDKTTAPGTEPFPGAGTIPPEGYAIIADFLVYVASGAGWSAADVINEAWDRPEVKPSPNSPDLLPPDAPAESVLDQLDESQTPLPMVGEPGSEVTVAAEEPTPPAESILDFIDTEPTPQPAAGTAQEAAKRAVNQATPPKAVQTDN